MKPMAHKSNSPWPQKVSCRRITLTNTKNQSYQPLTPTMPPNARPTTLLFDEAEPLHHALVELLDNKQAVTNDLSNLKGNNEEWTDVKHIERKSVKRDRILDDGVLIKLMKKSDYEGMKRLFTNLGIMALTVFAIHQMHIFPFNEQSFTAVKLIMFIPVYFFYGFQFQCFAFAGQHEFLHRNAFKTRWINDLCLFVESVFCFELGVHEKVMHKRHHTYTNNIDKDPELTSYFTREELENPGFRNIPFSRVDYFYQFIDVYHIFTRRAGRILNSAMGIAVDYSGTGWSLRDWSYKEESGIMRTLQMTALSMLTCYAAMFYIFGQTKEGLQGMLFWWIAPVLCGHPVVNYFRNLEHADCEVSKEPNCLLNTRSVRSNIVVRTLLWDTNYHAEHHAYPMVPFFNLHKINKLMYPHVVHNEKDHFTTQNWEAIKAGGWIDQQASALVKAHNAKNE